MTPQLRDGNNWTMVRHYFGIGLIDGRHNDYLEDGTEVLTTGSE
jgi:hypothetical protein